MDQYMSSKRRLCLVLNSWLLPCLFTLFNLVSLFVYLVSCLIESL